MTSREWATLGALALIWGAAFSFIKIAVSHIDPLTYVWLRLSIAACGLYLFMRLRGHRLNLPLPLWGSILVLALLNTTIPFALFGWGQQHIASGLAAILNATSPIWAVLVAHAFTADEKLTPARLIGVLIGVMGVATMVGPDLLAGGGDLLAQLACLVAAFCYALAGVWARRFRKLGVTPIKVATGQLLAGAFVMAPFALAIDQPWTRLMPPAEAWAAIILLALLCSAFAYVLYFRLIDSAGATNALLVTLLVPPVAILLGTLLFGERLATSHFLGLGLIALGLAAIDGRLIAFALPRARA
ncbi:DMT family transporter [Sphingomonas xanthus]|uniref:DMT family transporter n=2 Tax=Sphingomonas xanthus TaxID=2594473 RepID=A0A516IUH1_9SPHN|nr:DMT family transporter [Sphingomonas xanthus]